jgi:polar amino acid transport system substrate-binding protein
LKSWADVRKLPHDSSRGNLRIVILSLCFVFFLALLAWLILRDAGDNILNEVYRRGALYVGIEGDNPPFAFLENDQVVGLDADIARALAAALGVDVQFVVMGYDGLYDALQVGRVDVLISALWVDPDLWEDFRYSVRYFDAGQLLVTQVGSRIADPTDLEGAALAVEFGSEGDVWARRQARRLKSLDIKPYDAPVAVLDALAADAVDAAVIDRVAFMAYTREGVALVEAAVVSEEPYAAVTRAESARLREALDAALSAMIEDGRVDALVEKWF